MKNATKVLVLLPTGAQMTADIKPEDMGEDGGPSFEFIRKEAGMEANATLAMVPIRLDATKTGWLFVDEEGLIKRLKPNKNASELAQQVIVGPAVVWHGKYKS